MLVVKWLQRHTFNNQLGCSKVVMKLEYASFLRFTKSAEFQPKVYSKINFQIIFLLMQQLNFEHFKQRIPRTNRWKFHFIQFFQKLILTNIFTFSLLVGWSLNDGSKFSEERELDFLEAIPDSKLQLTNSHLVLN